MPLPVYDLAAKKKPAQKSGRRSSAKILREKLAAKTKQFSQMLLSASSSPDGTISAEDYQKMHELRGELLDLATKAGIDKALKNSSSSGSMQISADGSKKHSRSIYAQENDERENSNDIESDDEAALTTPATAARDLDQLRKRQRLITEFMQRTGPIPSSYPENQRLRLNELRGNVALLEHILTFLGDPKSRRELVSLEGSLFNRKASPNQSLYGYHQNFEKNALQLLEDITKPESKVQLDKVIEKFIDRLPHIVPVRGTEVALIDHSDDSVEYVERVDHRVRRVQMQRVVNVFARLVRRIVSEKGLQSEELVSVLRAMDRMRFDESFELIPLKEDGSGYAPLTLVFRAPEKVRYYAGKSLVMYVQPIISNALSFDSNTGAVTARQNFWEWLCQTYANNAKFAAADAGKRLKILEDLQLILKIVKENLLNTDADANAAERKVRIQKFMKYATNALIESNENWQWTMLRYTLEFTGSWRYWGCYKVFREHFLNLREAPDEQRFYQRLARFMINAGHDTIEILREVIREFIYPTDEVENTEGDSDDDEDENSEFYSDETRMRYCIQRLNKIQDAILAHNRTVDNAPIFGLPSKEFKQRIEKGLVELVGCIIDQVYELGQSSDDAEKNMLDDWFVEVMSHLSTYGAELLCEYYAGYIFDAAYSVTSYGAETWRGLLAGIAERVSKRVWYGLLYEALSEDGSQYDQFRGLVQNSGPTDMTAREWSGLVASLFGRHDFLNDGGSRSRDALKDDGLRTFVEEDDVFMCVWLSIQDIQEQMRSSEKFNITVLRAAIHSKMSLRYIEKVYDMTDDRDGKATELWEEEKARCEELREQIRKAEEQAEEKEKFLSKRRYLPG